MMLESKFLSSENPRTNWVKTKIRSMVKSLMSIKVASAVFSPKSDIAIAATKHFRDA
jgi:hypothetical protein